MKTKLLKFPWHVFLFALYPSLSLWAYNIGQVGFSAIYRAVLACLLIGTLLLVFLWLWLRDWPRAGITATLLLALFFSYGHVYLYFENVKLFGFLVGRHRFLAAVWLILAGLSIWWAAKKLKSASGFNSTLNLVTTVLIIFPLLTFTSQALSNWRTSRNAIDNAVASRAISDIRLPASEAPDVYYIILDGYGRSDILLNQIGFDNSSFLDGLRSEGFYIADCSQSNYGMTALSLASSLNMNYVTALGDEFTPDNINRYSPLWRLIKNSATEATFRQMGYRIVAFETGYDWTELQDAEYFFGPPKRGLSGFESLVLRDSAAVILDDMGVFDPFRLTPEDQKRELILYVLDKMKSLAEIPGPKFVFIHLVIPHQPFVFGPNGESLAIAQRTLNEDKYYSRGDYLLGYGNQVRFISKKIPDLMAQIIQNSATPPVIIIQGDHGPAQLEKENRMGILNAYYFPREGQYLYPTITPVNSFRTVFNAFFDGRLDLLPDVSNYSKYSRPYDFEVIPNRCVSP